MNTIAGPLLSGVFGGDIRELSARAVMAAFVAMEAKYGSLITGLRQSPAVSKAGQPLFSTLTTGLQTLVDRLVEYLPAQSVHLHERVAGIRWDGQGWQVLTAKGEHRFDSVVLATPAHATRELLASVSGNGQRMAALLPQQATSAVVVALAFSAQQAVRMRIPRGFGFLVPQQASGADRRLLACTFVDQKFSRRAPAGAVLLRAFFGGRQAEALLGESDQALSLLARQQLAPVLGPLPDEPLMEPLVRRWPRSLPQYTVGHLDRIRELESLAGAWQGLHLVGNAYHGVGLSDLIREGRATAKAIAGDS
jgi:oxygen-dependent protoporphyrinogen oxidase